MTQQAKIAARIAKLLALAADAAATEDERTAATAKATELMTRHGITASTTNQTTDELFAAQAQVWPYAVPCDNGHGRARAFLASQIAEAMGCRAVLHGGDHHQVATLAVVGMPVDLATLRQLLPVVLFQAEHTARQQSAGRPARQRPTFIRQFLSGYGRSVAERIRARRRQGVAEAVNDSDRTALILADWDTKVATLTTAKFPHIRTTNAPGASEAGRQAGRFVDLGDGMTGTSRAALTN